MKIETEEWLAYFESQGWSRELIKQKKREYDSKIKGLTTDETKFNLICRDLSIEKPPEIQHKINQEISEKDMVTDKAPKAKEAAEISVQQYLEAKMEGISTQISIVAGYLQKIAEDVGIWKSLEQRLVSLLETLLARTDAVSKGVAQIMPSPVPASTIPIQTPMTTAQAPAMVGAGQPINTAPVSNNVFAPAERLDVDGSAERGTAPPDKKYTFYPVVIVPIEFTKADDGSIKSIKCTFQYTDAKTHLLRTSWNAKYNSAEVFLAKSLISPNSIIKRLQVQQQVEVANWWLSKNSQ